MPVEAATHLFQLDPSNPTALDAVGTADDHCRMIKLALRTDFPNLLGVVTSSETHLNNPLIRTTPTANTIPYYNSNSTATTTPFSTLGLTLLNSANSATVISTLDLDSRYLRSGMAFTQPLTTNGAVSAATVTVSSTAPTITLTDTDWGNRSLHVNGGLMGFLNSSGGWAFYSDNAGNTTTPGTAYAAEFYITSDPRLKKGIRAIDANAATAFVRNVKGYTYRMTDTDKLTSGVLSTEVATMVPALVTTHEDGFDRVNYDAIVPYLLTALNFQIERNDLIENNFRALRDEVAALRREMIQPVEPGAAI